MFQKTKNEGSSVVRQIKYCADGKDALVQKKGLVRDLVCMIKQCSLDKVDAHGAMIDCFMREDAAYILGRIEGAQVHELQIRKEKLEAFLRALSWYTDTFQPNTGKGFPELYQEGICHLERINTEIARIMTLQEAAGSAVARGK
jgi:hypothetical protein